MQYQVTTKAGKTHTVESDLTDAQAQSVLLDKDRLSDFESSLASKRKLTPKMRAWLHVLAQWALNPREEQAASVQFHGILAMLTRAREAGKKFPKIKPDVGGQRIVLALSGAGKVNVTDGAGFHSGTWFGAIQPSGAFREGREYSRVSGALEALEADPAGVATQHGVATGECCFCARELTTKESRSVGYGPVCADRFGLPWGAIDPDLDAAGKEAFSV